MKEIIFYSNKNIFQKGRNDDPIDLNFVICGTFYTCGKWRISCMCYKSIFRNFFHPVFGGLVNKLFVLKKYKIQYIKFVSVPIQTFIRIKHKGFHYFLNPNPYHSQPRFLSTSKQKHN